MRTVAKVHIPTDGKLEAALRLLDNPVLAIAATPTEAKRASLKWTVRDRPPLKDPQPVKCAVPNCYKFSTIIHGDEPLCGEHALGRLDGSIPRPKVKAAAD